ncbi:MAG: heme ABC exporter ATP-binding protein CcmA [Pseudomonadota bacterium]
MVQALAIEHVSVRRGERLVLRDVSFRLDRAGTLLLKGHNGSGKTTLIRTIAGLLPAETGAITLEGGRAEAEPGEQSHTIGHANGLKSSLSVRENLRFWRDFLSGPRDGVDRALAEFQLDDLADIPTAYLSAGQKRRTGLARLLVADRPLWLLDEPTTSLDTASTQVVVAAIEQHVTSGGLAIVATHLDLATRNAREVTLRAGAVVNASSVEVGDD